jgi:hypothetical protein
MLPLNVARANSAPVKNNGEDYNSEYFTDCTDEGKI